MTDLNPYQHITDRDILAIAEAHFDSSNEWPSRPANLPADQLSDYLAAMRNRLAWAYPDTQEAWRNVQAAREAAAIRAAHQPVVWQAIKEAASALQDGDLVWVARSGYVYPARYRAATGTRHANFDNHGNLYWDHDTLLQGWAVRVAPTFTGVR